METRKLNGGLWALFVAILHNVYNEKNIFSVTENLYPKKKRVHDRYLNTMRKMKQ